MFYIEHTAVLNEHSMKHKSTVPTLPLVLEEQTQKDFGWKNKWWKFLLKKSLICLIVLYLKCLDTELFICRLYVEVGWVGVCF